MIINILFLIAIQSFFFMYTCSFLFCSAVLGPLTLLASETVLLRLSDVPSCMREGFSCSASGVVTFNFYHCDSSDGLRKPFTPHTYIHYKPSALPIIPWIIPLQLSTWLPCSASSSDVPRILTCQIKSDGRRTKSCGDCCRGHVLIKIDSICNNADVVVCQQQVILRLNTPVSKTNNTEEKSQTAKGGAGNVCFQVESGD